MDSYQNTYFRKKSDGSLTFATITIEKNNVPKNDEENKLVEPVESVKPVKPVKPVKSQNKKIRRSKNYSHINPIDFVKNGSIVIKLCRNTKGMNFRFFYVSNNSKYLRWFSPSKNFKLSNIDINQIVDIIRKPKDCFYKKLDPFLITFPADDIHLLVLKISYLEGRERGLDGMPFKLKKHYKPTKIKYLYLVFKNSLELEFWYLGLMSIVDSKNIDKYITYYEPHKSKVELSLYINDFYKYDPLLNYHQVSKLNFNKPQVLYTQIKKHRNKIKKRFTKLKQMDNELQNYINKFIIPILHTSSNLVYHCIQTFDNFGSNLDDDDLSRIAKWLYQIKIEYAVIKDIIKILKNKQLQIRNDRIGYTIPLPI